MICLQDIVYTTLPQATIINVTFHKLHLFVQIFAPSPDTQVKFNESMKNSFTLSIDCWTTNRREISTSSANQCHN